MLQIEETAARIQPSPGSGPEADWRPVLSRLERLSQEPARDSLARELAGLERAGAWPLLAELFRAILAKRDARPQEALQRLARIRPQGAPPIVQRHIARTRAMALEQAGHFREAAQAYATLNRMLPSSPAPRGHFYRVTLQAAALERLELPEDPHTGHIALLGFPRSGTTLLEMALESHPRIATHEETPAFGLARRAALLPGEPWSVEKALAAREAYYGELARRGAKPHAALQVDKLPVLSSQAALLENLFPRKRYIFMLRDPRDVVLSCYKQSFAPNDSTDNFRDFGETCRMYDFTMRQWFAHFTLDHPRVCYVRYERLAEDFEAEMARVLGFFGLEWSRDVLGFPQTAQARRAATPSYLKVRRGLGLGPQSAWANFRFLFELPEARRLDRWVSFFGYAD